MIWRLVFATLGLAGLLHVGIVLAIPYGIMTVFLGRFSATTGTNQILRATLPDHAARAVVAPSPDLLYGACAFDTGAGPVRIAMRPPSGYWSVALYNRSTDNFYHRNDSNLPGADFELILTAAAPSPTLMAQFPAAQFVTATHQTGVMLTRLLVLDRDKMDAALAAQASLTCDLVDRKN